jgi:hypothetical protein
LNRTNWNIAPKYRKSFMQYEAPVIHTEMFNDTAYTEQNV